MAAVKNVKVSWNLWIPWVWFFLVSTRSIGRWIAGDLSRGFHDKSNNLEAIVFGTLLILGIFILLKRKVRCAEIVRNNKAIVILFIYMAMSTIWSNFPEQTAVRGVRSIGCFIMVLVVLTEASPLDGIAALLRRCYYIHIPADIIAIKYFRSFGVMYTWSGDKEGWAGLTSHKNNLGQVMMCSGTYFTWNMVKTWGKKKIWRDLLFLFMTLYLLRGSSTWSSKTSIIVFIIGIVCLLGLQYFRKKIVSLRRFIFASLVALSLTAAFIQIGIDAFLEKSITSASSEVTGRDETLTGRTVLWSDLIAIAYRSPILGVGYGALWNVGPKEDDLYPLPNWAVITPWRPGQGHSGYVDLFVELGIVGVILTIVMMAAIVKNISDTFQDQFEYARIRLTYLIIILIDNITESSLLSGYHSLWFIFLLFSVYVPRRNEQIMLKDKIA